ncbi:MAG: hypothetical protein ACE5J9_04230 [Methanosarcinales archaeon]
MNETTVNRTKAAINALIDIEQLWINNAPTYNLSAQDLLTLKKRLEKAKVQIEKIYFENKEKMEKAEKEIKERYKKPKKHKKI